MTWIGKIDGAVVGTHTTQVPVTSTVTMHVENGLANNNTTDAPVITNLQRMGAYQNV